MNLSSLNPGNFGSSQVFIWLCVAAGILIVFILLREFICWYFKINQRIALLKKIERNSRPMKSSLTPSSTIKKTIFRKKDRDVDEDADEEYEDVSGEDDWDK